MAVFGDRPSRHELASIGLQLRAGFHTGEIEVRDEADAGGMAVHIAARVLAALARGDSTEHDLVVGSDIALDDRGTHRLAV